MNVLVCPATLSIGGSQRNAIDLAAAVRERGHEVYVMASPGPLEHLVRERSLPHVPLRSHRGRRPSLSVMRGMRAAVYEHRIDLVHAYESVPALEAFLGARFGRGVPVLTSVMSMSVPRRFPRSIPLTVGTQDLVDRCREAGHRSVALLEPPVDTEEDHPGEGGALFRELHGLDDQPVVVVVSRIHHEMKLEGLSRAIEAIVMLDKAQSVRLIVVGDGPAYGDLWVRAEEANQQLGRRAVVLTGAMEDPRPAYAAADIVLGMGGSVLRGMAFGKPAIVLGVGGFSEILTPTTVDRFLRDGFFGDASGIGTTKALSYQIAELLRDPVYRSELGTFGRELVCARFSLAQAAEGLEGLYRELIDRSLSHGPLLRDFAWATAWIALIKMKQLALRSGKNRVERVHVTDGAAFASDRIEP